MNQHWYQQSVEEIFKNINTSLSGLSEEEINQRILQYGKNQLEEKSQRSALKMLLSQLTETMVLILMAAGFISLLLGKGTEAIAILAIVVLFAIMGFVQEFRAEKAMAALKQLAVPSVRVTRGGKIKEISAIGLVPGDIVNLEAGNAIPADLRLVEVNNLRIQEASLTGESEAIEKITNSLSGDFLPIGDRRNMAYLGTTVTYGRGLGVVVETGMGTELGKIATLIQDVENLQTPLQKRLDQIGKSLAIGGVIAAFLVLVIGVLRGEPIDDMFLTAVSVAVAVVPEGLPAVVTITLALGAQRMLKRNALIRKLPAVETLGSVTVICSDKTGTLTENKMTVTKIDVANEPIDFIEAIEQGLINYSVPHDDQSTKMGDPVDAKQILLTTAMLCNDAIVSEGSDAEEPVILGDPTEAALYVAGMKAGLAKQHLGEILPRVAELPFDSVRKRMTTIHQVQKEAVTSFQAALPKGEQYLAFTKGAVDQLSALSDRVWVNGNLEPMTTEWRERIQTQNNAIAGEGVRVLGFAFRPLSEVPALLTESVEQNLIFIGMMGMMDPPRKEVAPAVAMSQRAGIRTIMITGDHPLTAVSIAKSLAITDQDHVISGSELHRMTDEELASAVLTHSVFARVSPEDKLRIVQALQSHGDIVAMTGDGVNDSPALKKADIGVAMGITGTDVAKEAAEMVLLDDNFATIVAAVREGRVIYDNLLRFIKFSLGGNVGKVLVMLGAPLLGINVALRPLQLLWLNLLTDGLMGLGLGVEPAEQATMERKPRPTEGPVLDRAARIHVSWVGALIALITLTLGAIYYEPGNQLWQTVIFATLGFTQIGHALGLRARGQSPFNLRSNMLMTVMTLSTLVLQIAVIYIPFLDRFFGLTPLPLPDLLLTVALGSLTFIGVRIENFLTRKKA